MQRYQKRKDKTNTQSSSLFLLILPHANIPLLDGRASDLARLMAPAGKLSLLQIFLSYPLYRAQRMGEG
jgi:hypothetical protein